MKKLFLTLVLCFVFLGHSQAQAALFALIFGDKVATENFNVGLEIGFPYATVSGIDGNSSNLGLHFGIGANMKLSENWSLNPAAYFLSSRGADLDALSLNSPDAELNAKFNGVPATLKTNFIDVPLFVNYRFTNSKFKVGLAPQISFRTGSNAVFSNETGDFEYDIENQTNGTDFGLITQLGYIWNSTTKNLEVHIQLRYFHGFSDIYDNTLVSGENKMRFVSLSLSFPFIKKTKSTNE
jgi:hypothetical protein